MKLGALTIFRCILSRVCIGWAFCAECNSGNGKNSCQGNCGRAAQGCHCDSTCVEFGDCCEDFSDYCGCVNQLRLVLEDSGGDGWGDAKLSLQKLYTGAKVSRDFHTLPKGSAQNTTLCIHERTMCYKVVVNGLVGKSRAVKNKQAEIKWSLRTLQGKEVRLPRFTPCQLSCMFHSLPFNDCLVIGCIRWLRRNSLRT